MTKRYRILDNDGNVIGTYRGRRTADKEPLRDRSILVLLGIMLLAIVLM